MRGEFKITNNQDKDGNPTGGTVTGNGINITFHSGQMNKDDKPNGAFVENLIEIAKQRLQFYQTTSEGRFKDQLNIDAINHLQRALDAINQRTANRQRDGKEGTYLV